MVGISSGLGEETVPPALLIEGSQTTGKGDEGKGFRPELFPVTGLPAGTTQYWNATQIGGMWFAGHSEGLVYNNGESWRRLETPTRGVMRTFQPHPLGVLVAGDSTAIFDGHTWHPVSLVDQIRFGGSERGHVLLTVSRGIYDISEKGEVKKLKSTGDAVHVTTHLFQGTHLIIGQNDRVYIWDPPSIRDGGDLYPWAIFIDLCNVQDLGNGAFFAYAAEGTILNGSRKELMPQFTKILDHDGGVGAVKYDDFILTASYFGGLFVVSLNADRILWRASVADIGNGYFLDQYEHGALLGTSSGLFVLPNPAQYTFSRLPKGDTLFTATIDGVDYLGLSTGIFPLCGKAFTFPEKTMSILPLTDGRLVFGDMSGVTIGSRKIGSQREVFALTETTHRKLAMLEDQGVTIASLEDESKAPTRVPIPFPPGSMAATRSGGFVIGTTIGAMPFDSDGRPQKMWGSGNCRVRPYKGGAIVANSEGLLYSEDGSLLAKIPGADIVDVVDWKDRITALARFPDGGFWGSR